ncbi:ABC transporter permease [Streptomyces sp. NPDC048665]|uniref:ABC transporter permease n=1 Tax=Streptomyces sp. NPDC048665 TaxID=3155490 RepID=UPI00343E8606
MTVLTGPVDAVAAAGRPRMTRWVVRLHRPALFAWAGLFAVVAGLLITLAGPWADAAAQGWRHYDACDFDRPCSYDQTAILRYKSWYNYTTYALNVLPFLVAAWAGAALTGRELESGTARLAWTQGASPARWLAARLTVPALALTAGTSLLFWLHHRAWTAGRGRIDTAKTWYDTGTFHANGPTTAALALAGLAAGALAGLLLRRALPALVLGVVFMSGVWGTTQQLLPHLWPAVTRTAPVTQQHADLGTGLGVDHGLLTRTGGHLPMPSCDSEAACDAAYAKAAGFYNTYHPYSHYWPLQLTASAVLLAVTGLLALACFRVLRRQVS